MIKKQDISFKITKEPDLMRFLICGQLSFTAHVGACEVHRYGKKLLTDAKENIVHQINHYAYADILKQLTEIRSGIRRIMPSYGSYDAVNSLGDRVDNLITDLLNMEGLNHDSL